MHTPFHFPSSWTKKCKYCFLKLVGTKKAVLTFSLLLPISLLKTRMWFGLSLKAVSYGGCCVRLFSHSGLAADPVTCYDQYSGHTNFPSQNPEVVFRWWGRNLTVSRRNTEHKNVACTQESTKHIWHKIFNRSLQFPLYCYSTMKQDDGWKTPLWKPMLWRGFSLPLIHMTHWGENTLNATRQVVPTWNKQKPLHAYHPLT